MSLVGFLTCTGAMIAIDVSAGIVAFSIIFAIYQYLKHYSGPARWADSRRSYFLQKAQENIRAAAHEKEHDRDWRPVILAMTRESKRLHQIMGFAAWVEGTSGITSAVRIIKGQGVKAARERKEAARQLSSDLLQIKSTAFPLVLSATDISEVLPTLVQSYGIGPFKANTLLINWLDDLDKGLSGLGTVEYARNLKSAFQQGLNVIILDTDLSKWDRPQAMDNGEHQYVIDVWWRDDSTGNFMLLVAYLLTRNEFFKKSVIRIVARGEEKDVAQITEQLQKHLKDIRIDAEPLVVQEVDQETIVQISSQSSMVFMPFRMKDYRFSDSSGGSLHRLLPQLPLTVLAKAAQDIDLEAEPDEGLLGDLAAASDALESAQKAYRQAYKKAQQLKSEADRLTLKLSELGSDDEDRAELIVRSDQAIKEYEAGYRKAAKARVKVEVAVRELEKMAEAGE